jgi:hypothetical protein
MILANGLEYPAFPEWREPSATIVTRIRNKQPSRIALSANVERSPWRELHALTVLAVDRNTNGGPLALENVRKEEAFDLWVGGLVAAGNGKLVDAIESVFHVPAAMLTEPSQRTYEAGVVYAELMERRLSKAVTIYHNETGENLDRPEMKNRRQTIRAGAAAQFWTDVEQEVPRLLEAAIRPPEAGAERDWKQTAWGRSAWHAAVAAYDHACAHESARQIRAYALGLESFFSQKRELKEVGSEVEA